jgi:hypothetical protein
VTDAPAGLAGEIPPDGGGGSRRTRRLVGFAVGVVLLLAAAWVLYSQRGAVERAWESARHARWWLVALALTLPLGNWLLISASFWTMMRRHGRIGYAEMSQCIGAAWLLNYLPLRAGMVGRIAYHRAVNGIAVRDSLSVMLWNMGIGAVAVFAVIGIVIGPGLPPQDPRLAYALAAGLLVPAFGRFVLAPRGMAWVADVLLLRYLDMLVWVARYVVVFAIVGEPISLGGAVAVAAACQAALLVPFIGNGLGVREWVVGLTASALPAALVADSGDLSTATGLLADVVNRAAEIAAAIAVGQVSLWALSRRMSRLKRAESVAGAGPNAVGT